MPHHRNPIAGHKSEGGEEHQVVRTLLRESGHGAADGKSKKVKRPDTQDATFEEGRNVDGSRGLGLAQEQFRDEERAQDEEELHTSGTGSFELPKSFASMTDESVVDVDHEECKQAHEIEFRPIEFAEFLVVVFHERSLDLWGRLRAKKAD